jgi:site-specific DNA recombinase
MTEHTTTDTTPDALAVYMRVSGEGQKTQGTIENQRTALDRYLAVHAITPYGWYQDEAYSGTIRFADRPDAARLLADMRAGHVKTVLVAKLDRFGRNAREILNAVHDLEQQGARLISIKENVDTRTSAGRFFLTVLAGVAELERDLIAERTTEGVARRLESTTSLWMGGYPPYGYRAEGKKRESHLVIEDTIDASSGYSERDVALLAWHLLLEQNWACRRIADYLSSLGIPTRTQNNPWTPTVVYQIFTNPIYKGERHRRAKDGTVIIRPVTDAHGVSLALVTTEQWERGQQVLAMHRSTSTVNPARPYLLRGMMRCGLSGAPFSTSWRRVQGGATGAIWRFYVCATHLYRCQHARRRPGNTYPHDCLAAPLDADWVEGQVWTEVEQFIRNPGPTLLELAAQAGDARAQAETHRAALADLQRDLDAQQSERDTILAYFRKGRMSERDVDRQLADIAREEATILEKRNTLTSALAETTARSERVEGARLVLQHLHALLDENPIPTPVVQRTAVEALVLSMRVETIFTGEVDARGRPKRTAKVHATYVFQRPTVTVATDTTTGQRNVNVPPC